MHMRLMEELGRALNKELDPIVKMLNMTIERQEVLNNEIRKLRIRSFINISCLVLMIILNMCIVVYSRH
jgi:hypothetical protein